MAFTWANFMLDDPRMTNSSLSKGILRTETCIVPHMIMMRGLVMLMDGLLVLRLHLLSLVPGFRSCLQWDGRGLFSRDLEV